MTDEWAGKIAVVIRKRKQIAGAMLNIIRILKKGGAGMTENEASVRLEMIRAGLLSGTDAKIVSSEENIKDITVIINALEEIQQYRAIGTPEELQDMKSNYFEALSDWRQYRKIGTLEECRAAVEKQTAKKVKSISQVKDGDSYVGLIGRCPCCGVILEEDTVYCDCGQRLDWGDEE